MKKTKVLYIGSYYPTLGGAEKYQYEICKYRKDSKSSWILCPNIKGTSPKDPCKIIRAFTLIKNKETVKRWSLLEYVQNYSFIIPAFLKGKKLIKKENIDIIHVSFGLAFGICGWLLKKATHRPLILTLHGSGFNFKGIRKIFKPITKRVLENTDKIIAVSNSILNEAKEIAPIRGEVIYNSLKISEFNNKGDGNYVLAIGRLAKMKGFDILISAAKELPSYKFLILGDGPEKENLERMIKEYKISNVTLAGQKTSIETKKFISRCSIFVMPSKFGEGLPFALVEAIATGKPVIGTKVRGIPELIDKNGVVIEPNNINELKKTIKTLMDNPSKRKIMGKESKLFAKKKLNIEQEINRLEEIYNSFSEVKYERKD